MTKRSRSLRQLRRDSSFTDGNGIKMAPAKQGTDAIPFLDESRNIRSRFATYWKLGRPVMLFGPPGTGKSTLAAELGGDELITFTAGDAAPSDLLGYARLMGDRIEWFKGLLQLSVETGRPIFIDEVDALSVHAYTMLLSATDHRRVLTIPGLSQTCDVHPAWRICCAYNGQSGYDAIPRAFRDRCCYIHVPRLSADAEVKLLLEQTGLDIADVETLVTIAQVSRQLDDANGISFRALLAAAEALEAGIPREYVVEDCLLGPMFGTETSSREAFMNALRAEGIEILQGIAELRDDQPLEPAIAGDDQIW